MIISRTPLRISFVGGGTDIDWFYQKEPGAVVSTAINKYIYITVNKKFDSKIRASYSKTEIVDKVKDLKHELIRESLRLVGIDGGIEITSISDIPSRGTGLGSSSTYTVGLLNALHAFKGEYASAEQLASEACRIEIEILGKLIGKQDQYLTAYGGFQYLQFNPNGTVYVDPIICRGGVRKRLESRLLMLFTGLERRSGPILENQAKAVLTDTRKMAMMSEMANLARKMQRALSRNHSDSFGELLHQNWLLKKKLAKDISTPQINDWYDRSRRAGAIGGKICGAGGGGFLLLYAPKSRHQRILKALPELRPLDFSFEPQGSKIIYVGG
jgi:D-glycero-alpha-D-manno-heptose-7-phosphate kinase